MGCYHIASNEGLLVSKAGKGKARRMWVPRGNFQRKKIGFIDRNKVGIKELGEFQACVIKS